MTGTCNPKSGTQKLEDAQSAELLGLQIFGNKAWLVHSLRQRQSQQVSGLPTPHQPLRSSECLVEWILGIFTQSMNHLEHDGLAWPTTPNPFPDTSSSRRERKLVKDTMRDPVSDHPQSYTPSSS
ncbi:hypothetical protein H109_04221 [Trichophyton interdigitale MR816]|uniref:Uncharacterized protein n=1 Tax=Trichophyton interdigitale (strain MR816) TaxID=1215338 RepID=A0A059J7Q3_TRIIM|nr:hypothetical protein H101_05522 [Trichophyton interdigitale H6]KDB23911.1 hypothetical protein H109_04221 [Trichophyton interdigitale MR816]